MPDQAFKTFATVQAAMTLHYTTTLRAVCRGSGNRFAAKLEVVLVVSTLYPEWASFDAWVATLHDQSRTLEEWAGYIWNAVAETVKPMAHTIRLVSTGEAIHGPLTVEVSQ